MSALAGDYLSTTRPISGEELLGLVKSRLLSTSYLPGPRGSTVPYLFLSG